MQPTLWYTPAGKATTDHATTLPARRSAGDRITFLGHATVVIELAVIFLGQALTWDGVTDLLAPGLASAAVFAAPAMFLWQAARERQLDRETGPPGQVAGDHGEDAGGVA